MTPVPSSLLRQTATVEAYAGESGERGPVFGDPVSVKTRVEPRNRRVVRPDGTEAAVSAVAWVRPDAAGVLADGRRLVGQEDRFVCDDVAYEVVEVATIRGLSRPTHRELVLAPGVAG